MLVREVNRSAAVAWSPLANRPTLLAAATLAGTMTVDFDPSGKLEIFDISEKASRGMQDALDMPCIGLTSTSERVHRLAWRNPLPNVFENGLIVGGLGNGAINIWNPTSMIERTQADPLVASIVSHSGPINALDFNPLQQTLLASGGPSGELYIFNLADPRKPTVHQPGTSQQSSNMGAITSVAFHPRHRHILASSSQNGTTVIWDLREKRPAYSFSDPNRSFHCKSIAWHPDQPMVIAAASDDDEAPFINIWDLHMTIAPNSTLKAHKRGIMSIAWCPGDKSVMSSAGKDNRVLVWDVSSASLVSELGSSSHWYLDHQWSTKLPTMMSTCTLDGKVRVFSVSDFENLATPRSMEAANQQHHSSSKNPSGISEDDLFNLKGANNHHATVSSSNILRTARQLSNGATPPPRPPAWLRRPAGASFAFGGVLISFNSSSKAINTRHIPSHQSLASRATSLQAAMESGSFTAFCEEKLASLSPTQVSERETWTFLKSLLASNSRQDLLMHLDMDPEIMSETINQYLRTLPTPPGMLDDTESSTSISSASAASDSSNPSPAEPNGFSQDNLFDGEDDPSTEAFVIPSQSKQMGNSKPVAVTPPRDMSPIFLRSEDQAEQVINKALMIGDYEAAVECCVRIGKMADALVIAACGGDALWKRTQNIFFRQNKARSYLHIVSAIANKDWDNFIQRIDLAHWKEALAILCTHPSESEFASLCSVLGKRLESQHMTDAATISFLCASAVDQVTAAWMKHLAVESASCDDSGQRVMLIHELMEKILVFAAAAKVSPSHLPDIVLHQYARYAELLANQGLFEISLKYLKLLDLKSTNASTAAQSTLHLLDRVYHALPANVAQACYGSNLPSLYQSQKQARNVSSASSAKGPSKVSSGSHVPIHSMGNHGPYASAQTSALASPMGAVRQSPPIFQAPPARGPGVVQAPISTFTPVPVSQMIAQAPYTPATHTAPPPAGRHGPRTTATFTPIAPGIIQPASASGMSTFVPGPATSTMPPPAANGGIPPPASASAKKSRVAPPTAFTPSAPAPAPRADTADANGNEKPKKKKVKKTAPKSTASAMPLGPTPISELGSGTPASSIVAGGPMGMATAPTGMAAPPGGVSSFPAAGFGASAISSVAIPPPKARSSRVVPPTMARSGPTANFAPPAPTASFPPPASGPHPPASFGAAPPDPSTWNPQAPLPPHLLAAAGAQQSPPGAFTAPPPSAGSFNTPAGFHPPPAGSFTPSSAPVGGYQTFQPGPRSNATTAPPAAATPPPPKPGRAKKQLAAPVVAPTPVYVTGPQAEAMAAPKDYDPSQADLDLLKTLTAVLDKIAATGDSNHPDLLARFEDFQSKLLGGNIPAAVIPTLTELAQAMLDSKIGEAQEKHGEVTNSPHYHAIGSKAMLGMKRMIILIQRHGL